MKKRLKSLFNNLGLLTLAEKIYFNVRTLSPRMLQREIAYRFRGLPDNLPYPPANLIYDIIASYWLSVYYDSGKQIVDHMARHLATQNIAFSDFRAILDFGCGCGRLIRHLPSLTSAELFGSDYNPELVHWCKTHLEDYSFFVNSLPPPLSLSESSIDFIFARSVFTHLPQALQQAWIEEMHRVLRTEGFFYLTMHGPTLLGGLTEQQQEAVTSGELVVIYSEVAGENLCSSYANASYMKKLVHPHFEIQAYFPGTSEKHLKQDAYLLKKVSR